MVTFHVIFSWDATPNLGFGDLVTCCSIHISYFVTSIFLRLNWFVGWCNLWMLCTSVVHNVHAALNVSIVHLNKAYNTTLRFDKNLFHRNHALCHFGILPYFKSSHLPRLSLQVVTNICVTIECTMWCHIRSLLALYMFFEGWQTFFIWQKKEEIFKFTMWWNDCYTTKSSFIKENSHMPQGLK